MLKTRIVTALALLAVLLPVLYLNNFTAFAVIVTVFFGAAIWEAFRLFNPDSKRAALIAVFWTAAFAYGFFFTPGGTRNPQFWFPICVAIWIIRFVPSLKMGRCCTPLRSSAVLPRLLNSSATRRSTCCR
jgi:phosphatidate cytidylyltransferase